MFDNVNLQQLIFGRFTLDQIPYHEPILLATFAGVAVVGVAVLATITYFRFWGPLWRDWVTSIDHKKIGIMYCIFAMIMLLRGFADAIMMRSQQAIAFGDQQGYLPPHHYDQIFTAHGMIMIFFVAMPFVTGLMNFAVPLQIGARDVAFPFLNNFSFWMTVSGGMLVMTSLFVGEFSRATWLAYPPLSGAAASPGVGVDYYIWALQIAGVGTTLSGINLIATIVKMRAPGMTMMKLPIFVWSSLCTNILIVAAFPILTAVSRAPVPRPLPRDALLHERPRRQLDVVLQPHLDLGSPGSLHPDPARLRRVLGDHLDLLRQAPVRLHLDGLRAGGHHHPRLPRVAAPLLHDGSGADVNSFFGITTMIISIPTGAKIFNWMFTMYRGRIRFDVPMMWVVAFIVTFVIGGMTGVLLAVPPADFVLHNSLFLIAHFHNVIIGGVLFGMFAGVTFWFPKAFGFKLDEFWGKVSLYLWVTGFYVAFMPLYVLGLMGVTRRMQHFDDPSLQPWFVIAAIGALIIAAGIGAQIVMFVVSIRRREELRDHTGDPWGGRTLEWATSSPPPDYNFAFTPVVHDSDAWWDMKARGFSRPMTGYKPIHMPKNTATGAILAALSFICGFAMVWYVWWLAALSFLALVAVSIIHTFNYDREYYIPAETVSRVEAKRTRELELA